MGSQRLVFCTLLVVVSVWSGICNAAKKVDIRIVPRTLSEEEKLTDAGPIPFRPPEVATGPYSYYVDHVGCIKDFSVKMEEKPFLLDVCHLKNVTFIEDIASRDNTNTENDSPPSRKILGMFRGWHIDPITKKYKIAIFNDGDLCAENIDMRYAIHIELVPSAVHDIVPHAFGFKKISECTYAIKVEFYVSDFELNPTSGIHTNGVLDLSDPEETIEHMCGVRKCKYAMVQEKIEEVENNVQQMKEMLSTLGSTSVSNLTVNTASLILRSSTDVMEKALELLHSIEAMYDNIQVEKKESREIGVGTESDPPNTMDRVVVVTKGADTAATTES